MTLEIIAFARTHLSRAVSVAMAVTALVTVAVGIYSFALAPTRKSFTLEFRPTFAGADQKKYPNGVIFSPTDAIASNVMDAVYAANHIQDYCKIAEFREGFAVTGRSSSGVVLDAQYSAAMAEPRLTAIERDRLANEYKAKLQALSLQFSILFVQPVACRTIPKIVVEKALNDVLTTWASDAVARRGVLRLDIEMLPPSALDTTPAVGASQLLRADLVRSILVRITNGLDRLSLAPGADPLRLADGQTSIGGLRTQFDALVRSDLDPLISATERTTDSDSIAWASAALALANRDQQSAEFRATAFQTALQMYERTASATPALSPNAARDSVIGTAVTPQIDRSFIDRIIEMEERNRDDNVIYRQKLTNQMLSARLDAVTVAQRAAYYQGMVANLRTAGRGGSVPNFDARLKDIVDRGKVLSKAANDLYVEFSRVSLRASSAIFGLDRPVEVEMWRVIGWIALLKIVVGVFGATVLLVLSALFLRQVLTTATSHAS